MMVDVESFSAEYNVWRGII